MYSDEMRRGVVRTAVDSDDDDESGRAAGISLLIGSRSATVCSVSATSGGSGGGKGAIAPP